MSELSLKLGHFTGCKFYLQGKKGNKHGNLLNDIHTHVFRGKVLMPATYLKRISISWICLEVQTDGQIGDETSVEYIFKNLGDRYIRVHCTVLSTLLHVEIVS